MNPRELLPADGAKTGLVISAVVILLSGFLLFNAFQAKNKERDLRIQKEQELSQKLAELTQAQTDLEELKRQKEESDLAFQGKLTELEGAVAEARQNEEKSKARVAALTKDKEQLSATVDQNAAMIAKLNKKIEKLEFEKEDLRKSARGGGDTGYGSGPASAASEAASMGAEGYGADADGAPSDRVPQATEVVDLGRIVLHGESREPARVEHVNTMYGFIVLSAGADDGLKIDGVVNVSRDNRFIAKAVIKKVRSSVATALLLPEWTREEVRLGDQISVNTPEPPLEAPKRRLADLLPR